MNSFSVCVLIFSIHFDVFMVPVLSSTACMFTFSSPAALLPSYCEIFHVQQPQLFVVQESVSLFVSVSTARVPKQVSMPVILSMVINCLKQAISSFFVCLRKNFRSKSQCLICTVSLYYPSSPYSLLSAEY